MFVQRQFLSTCQKFDIVVVGGGIIGAATAKTLKDNLNSKIALIEKESGLGQHQSSHNSNVIHAGIYYPPTSLKAKLCVKGVDLIYDYCDCKNITVRRNGKLIIAQDVLETYRLKVLYRNSVENGVPVELLIDWGKVFEIQPYCKGLQALWSPNTGNVDWGIVTKTLGQDFVENGGEVFFNCEVKSFCESSTPNYPILIKTKTKEFYSKFAVICTGLDGLPKNENLQPLSLRVNYNLLNQNMGRFIKTNIYALPVIDMPFLGIHITPTTDSRVLVGPSAVPSFKLDGYRETDINLSYVKEILSYPGFQTMFLKNFQTNLNQVKQNLCRCSQAEDLRKYFPMISTADVIEGPRGVLGQILQKNGDFVDDFLIDFFEGKGIWGRVVNCRFIPSPGATSCLSIAQMIADKISTKIQ